MNIDLNDDAIEPSPGDVCRFDHKIFGETVGTYVERHERLDHMLVFDTDDPVCDYLCRLEDVLEVIE